MLEELPDPQQARSVRRINREGRGNYLTFRWSYLMSGSSGDLARKLLIFNSISKHPVDRRA
jgi:hypothetical protein